MQLWSRADNEDALAYAEVGQRFEQYNYEFCNNTLTISSHYDDIVEYAEVMSQSTESAIDSENPSGERFVAFLNQCVLCC